MVFFLRQRPGKHMSFTQKVELDGSGNGQLRVGCRDIDTIMVPNSGFLMTYSMMNREILLPLILGNIFAKAYVNTYDECIA